MEKGETFRFPLNPLLFYDFLTPLLVRVGVLVCQEHFFNVSGAAFSLQLSLFQAYLQERPETNRAVRLILLDPVRV